MKMSSGIYMIEVLPTGKKYIGSASCFSNRWSAHRYELKRNKHGNQKLQHAYNKYGLESFVFSILEVCPEWSRDIQVERETHWMQVFNPELNIAPVAMSRLGCKISDEEKARRRCFREFWNRENQCYVHGNDEIYAWDFTEKVAAAFAIPDLVAFLNSNPKPAYVLESGKTKGGYPRYVINNQTAPLYMRRLEEK